MPAKLYFLKKESAADEGEELTLNAAIRPPIRGDSSPSFVSNYNSAMDKRVLMVLIWLIEKLYAHGVLKLADFADFPLLNKIYGEKILDKPGA